LKPADECDLVHGLLLPFAHKYSSSFFCIEPLQKTSAHQLVVLDLASSLAPAKRRWGNRPALSIARRPGASFQSMPVCSLRVGERRIGDVAAQIAQFGDLDALEAEQQAEFAAMMNVVAHDTPDRPLI